MGENMRETAVLQRVKQGYTIETFVGAVPDLKDRTTPGGTLYVFALPP